MIQNFEEVIKQIRIDFLLIKFSNKFDMLLVLKLIQVFELKG